MIGFDEIPANLRAPFFAIEFNSSIATSNLSSTQPYKSLVIGQKLASGTAPAAVPVQVTTKDQAKTLFGVGSMLALMFEGWFANNQSSEVWALPFDELGGGTAATGTITVTGTITKSGVLYLRIMGKVVRVSVTAGDSVTVVATSIKDAINADTTLPVTADNTAGVVTVTCRWKGATGNKIDMRDTYAATEVQEYPTGLSLAYSAMGSGAGNPDISTGLAALGDVHYTGFVMPFLDSTNLGLLEDELEARSGPMVQRDGYAYSAEDDTFANLATLGNGKNSQFISILGTTKAPTPSWVRAAIYGALAAFHLQLDPARPLQNLQMKGALAPKKTDRLAYNERNLLLYDGIATERYTEDGSAMLEMAITTYKKNSQDGDDESYLRIETMATLSYIRYDWRNYILNKYPRHKLGSDGVKYAPGQPVMTPSLFKSETISRALEWQNKALVENVDNFIEALLVERDASNVDRLNARMQPDLINQFRVAGGQIQFLL